MVFDIVIYNYVNKDPFFIVQLANAVAGDTNNTVSIHIASQFRDTHLTILTTLHKNAFDIIADINSILPKGIIFDVSFREPTVAETVVMETYLKG